MQHGIIEPHTLGATYRAPGGLALVIPASPEQTVHSPSIACRHPARAFGAVISAPHLSPCDNLNPGAVVPDVVKHA
jgi:hypothetical protein